MVVAAPWLLGACLSGPYRTELVEDETYLWTVTRYVHLNPVRAGIVEQPAAWAWSSYPGYAHRGRRLKWVAYDELLASWGGAFDGSDPAGDYRRYVTAGLSESPESPWKEAYQGRSREVGIRRTDQGDGGRRTAPRTAQGITTIAEFTPFTSH